MKILFDLSATQAYSDVLNHGGSEYAKAIFTELIKLHPENVTVFYKQNLELDSEIAELITEKSLKILFQDDIDSICNYILENSINIFYSALAKAEYNRLISMQSKTFKVIITIHGLRYLEMPGDTYERFYSHSIKSRVKIIYKGLFPNVYKKSLVKNYGSILGAYKIITVSNHSRKSILNFFPELNTEKILVFYSPLIDYTREVSSETKSTNGYSVSHRKYFLMVSGSIWIKNCYRPIKAFDNLISSNPEFKEYRMLITGMKNHSFSVKNQENFVFTDYVSRKTLENLFKNSLALIYPSLNEGFGYPPLEAMKYGIPVFASEIGPVKEVCGDAAFYFNPLVVTEIESSLLSAITRKDLFSDVNLKIRYDRYKLIKDRQEGDLKKMISLLTEPTSIN